MIAQVLLQSVTSTQSVISCACPCRNAKCTCQSLNGVEPKPNHCLCAPRCARHMSSGKRWASSRGTRNGLQTPTVATSIDHCISKLETELCWRLGIEIRLERVVVGGCLTLLVRCQRYPASNFKGLQSFLWHQDKFAGRTFPGSTVWQPFSFLTAFYSMLRQIRRQLQQLSHASTLASDHLAGPKPTRVTRFLNFDITLGKQLDPFPSSAPRVPNMSEAIAKTTHVVQQKRSRRLWRIFLGIRWSVVSFCVMSYLSEESFDNAELPQARLALLSCV